MSLPQIPPSFSETPPPAPTISALDGNRIALSVLVVQNVVSLIAAQKFGLGLGLSLFLSLVVNAALLLTVFRRQTMALVGDTRWRTLPAWGLTLGAFVLLFMASRAFSGAITFLLPGMQSATPDLLSRGRDLWWMLLAGGLLVPVIEEVAFRGMMLRGHERAAGPLLAAITTSLAFGIAHGAPVSVAGIIPLAYGIARLVQYTGSFWSGVVVHALNNTLALGLGYYLISKNPEVFDQATKTSSQLKDSALTLPMGLGLLLIGCALLAVTHLWLKPKPDAQYGVAQGPVMSLSYIVIVLFGLVSLLATFPAVQGWLTHVSHIIQ